MEIILLKQICIMFLLIAVGVFLVKKDIFPNREGKTWEQSCCGW